MASNVRVQLNIRGVNEVMRSEGVSRDIAARGQRMARAAGPGFEAKSDSPHRWVARTWVQSTSREAAAREARENILTRSIDAGRG